MPISEPVTAYDSALDGFLASRGVRDVPGIYHAVRNLAYFSSGERSPEAVIRTGRGACTAKHILLRDLLRRQGEVAAVEIVAGDFAAGMQQTASMPVDLRDMIRDAGVADFHCYVVWQGPGQEVRLDATWPDVLAGHGFAVNTGWDGTGDTVLAIRSSGIKAREENVITAKARLVSGLTADQVEKRRLLLKLLSEWMATLP